MIIIKSPTIIDSNESFVADIIIDNGKILELDKRCTQYTPPNATVIDAENNIAIPGLIDAHCHILLDTGKFKTADNWKIGSESAALGGITTVVDFVSPVQNQSLKDALQNRCNEATESIIDYTFHMTITNDTTQTLNEMESLPTLGISSLKLYTTYKPFYYVDDDAIIKILEKAASLNLTSLIHCENNAIVTHQTNHVLNNLSNTLKYHALTRPDIAEIEATSRIINLSKYTKAPVVIAHNSCAETVRLIANAKRQNIPVFSETAPQYLFLDDSLYDSEEAWRYILQPPLRSKQNTFELRELITENIIDMLITDHCEYTKTQKTAVQTLDNTPGGLPGLQTLLPLSFQLTKEIPRLSINNIVRMLSENPAKIYGLWPHKGAIKPGFDADIAIIDTQNLPPIDESTLHGPSNYSPFHNFPQGARVKHLLRRAELLVKNYKLCHNNKRGKFIHASTNQP